jgi:3-(3-hydroxy-phenyl)propionate hydroxylase
MRPGTPAFDAPISSPCGHDWFLEALDGAFTLVSFGGGDVAGLENLPLRCLRVGADIEDRDGLLAGHYDAEPGTAYLFRPDQHVVARFRNPDAAAIAAALDRAMGRT